MTVKELYTLLKNCDADNAKVRIMYHNFRHPNNTLFRVDGPHDGVLYIDVYGRV